ncbi:ATPase [Actinoplanes lobatus]|uniref:ATPase n=1 Tax=Actinoplanes lobatus TaxID=113568 RepID=A0A7W7MKC0_9ACTN|nr:cation-transporting P-type ATPase [Actinoplanes lobatus]MBB4753587.1 Ca2+-transporting ATPase [Actinoplanes lobatus]GGN84678.1 ATPase [Actinoplanes lobatus]GIE38124.1 ATPase [Actinoplanes lobatus]
MTTTDAGQRLTGLSSGAAVELLRVHGPNAVARPRPKRLAGRVLHQLTDPLVALLLAAAVVTTVLRDVADTLVILLVVLVNTAIGVVQEVRADRAIAALDRLAAPTARVVRDGSDAVIPAADLVPGDLVHLEAGDIVPADLRLHTAFRLRADESALTGESAPVTHEAGDESHAGTVVVTGRATGLVVRTGPSSALGRIAALVVGTRSGPTPLQRRLGRLSRVLGLTAVILSAVVFVLGLLAGRELVMMAVTAVSLVVAAVPESLPAVVTLALALGASRMAQAQAIPRRLHAVETLGSVTVIASDKTGTLTEGRMAVQAAAVADANFSVAGPGYAPQGRVQRDDQPIEPPASLLELARASLLCNDAALVAPDADHSEWTAVGDPLEAALVAFAGRCGLDVDAERDRHPRTAEHPFDQAQRRMVTAHHGPGGTHLVVCKGAPEAVLREPVVAAAPDTFAALRAVSAELAADGLRVLAVAAADDPAIDVTDPVGLRPLGVVGIGDPLRSGAPDIAATFAAAGVRLILVTGDHPATATAIGDRLGLLGPHDRVVNGDTGAPGDDPEHVRVYARTQPEQKLDIIAALQQRGHVVAMTGDGVNDAPALRQADIGVAMGGGTEVARQAADLVLVDDNLATVAHAIGEGRRIYDNIRRFLRYALSGGAAEIFIMLTGPFLGLAVPLLPAQILWVNLITHGLPGVALGAEPAAADVMRRPPRSPQESVLGDGLLRDILLGGLAITVTVLGSGVVAHSQGRPWQTVVFVVLGLAQLGVAMAVRSRRVRGGPGNPALIAAVVISAVLQIAGVLVPVLRELLGTEALTAAELLACAAVSVLPGIGLRLQRHLRW